MPIWVACLLAHLPFNFTFEFSTQSTLEENGIVHVGNGHVALSHCSLANNVHDVRFTMLIQVSKYLGFAGSAAIRLEVSLEQQIRTELLEQIVEVVVQCVLFFDEQLDRIVSEESRSVLCVLQDLQEDTD